MMQVLVGYEAEEGSVLSLLKLSASRDLKVKKAPFAYIEPANLSTKHIVLEYY